MLNDKVFPEQAELTALIEMDGEGLTVNEIELDAVTQVELVKLATSGPTTTRYIPPSLVTALEME